MDYQEDHRRREIVRMLDRLAKRQQKIDQRFQFVNQERKGLLKQVKELAEELEKIDQGQLLLDAG